MPSTSSSVQLRPHLPNLPSSNLGLVVSTKRRKYDTSYLSFEFTSTGDEERPDAVRLLLQTKDKLVAFFQRKYNIRFQLCSKITSNVSIRLGIFSKNLKWI
ncbi:zinc finger BED domain-containing protein 5 [Trichonephila clavata]|uniref:Zinc finger BED domain-containing protein 5 n=1 Tax=Trichonephila clavata TaxID=2740835 RepID=A0A8X6F295_TRICU|nr:zinc finger BED domain-containing protein 5 [Trichonephila clavata]